MQSQPVNAAAGAAAAAGQGGAGLPQQQQQQVQNGGANPAGGAAAQGNPTATASGNVALPPTGLAGHQAIPSLPPMFPMMMPGMMMPPPPFMMPPPPVPPGLDRLSDEELRLLEGTERRNVEERIKFLRNVQTLLDASSALMGQYQAISLQYPIPQVAAAEAAAAPSVPVTSEEAQKNSEEPVASSSKGLVPEVEEATKLEDKVTIRDVIEEEEEDGEQGASKSPSPSPNDEFAEVRRRRLERFSNPMSSSAGETPSSSSK